LPAARLSDPDRVVARLDSFVTAYGTRSALFELWNHNPSVFELLVLLFDRSEFLAELAIRSPELVDELVSSGRLQQRKRAEETLRDLRHGIEDDNQHRWLRRYHQAELMRIGLRDILGLADFEQYLTELSALADACLQYALEAVVRRRRMKSAPFAIVGLGKLGGAEIDYGSDLDVIFVAGVKSRSMSNLLPVAAEVLDLLAQRTELGIVFHTDARLRPDGEKGLLVNTLEAYEQYCLQRAQLWEIQTLTRARFIAGDNSTGKRFEELAGQLTDFSPITSRRRPTPRTTDRSSKIRGDALSPVGRVRVKVAGPPDSAATPKRVLPAAYSPAWAQTIHKMRTRIERERTPPGKDSLAIKTGAGGLMDAEFVAQTLCMEYGWREPNTLRALELGRAAGVLPDADQFISSYRQLRRVEGILRRWSYEGETVLPDDPEPFYRVSVRCGFETPESFRKALVAWRRKMRSTYLKVFSGG
jgi:glutamate-ammonia-ligase adenylyltransferase